MMMSVREVTFIVPEEGVNGIMNFFFKRDIKKTASNFGFSFDQVMESLEKVRKDNPGKKAVITFHEKKDETPGFIVEEKGAYFNRLEEQVNRTGILVRTPI